MLNEPGRWMIHTLRTVFFETLCWPFFVPKKCWGLGLLDANSLHRGYVILRNAMPPKRFEAWMHPVPAETKDDEVYIYIYVYEVYLWGINMRICEVQHMWGICEVYMRCICEVFMWGVCIYIYNIYIMFMCLYIYICEVLACVTCIMDLPDPCSWSGAHWAARWQHWWGLGHWGMWRSHPDEARGITGLQCQDPDEQGIAHMMEHVCFLGSRKRLGLNLEMPSIAKPPVWSGRFFSPYQCGFVLEIMINMISTYKYI